MVAAYGVTQDEYGGVRFVLVHRSSGMGASVDTVVHTF